MTLAARLLEWGEDWARARGYWAPDEAPGEPALWWVRPFEGGLLRVCLRDVGGWTLTPLQFWLFAHAVDSERLDSQRCPGCEGSKAQHPGVPIVGEGVVWVAGKGPGQSRPCPTCTGPAVECGQCDKAGAQHWTYPGLWSPDAAKAWGSPGAKRSCAVCGGGGSTPGEPLGYISRPLARVVCEAMPPSPKPNTCHAYKDAAQRFADRHDGVIRRRTDGTPGTKEPGPGWVVEYPCSPGDPAARLALELHADALQAEGDHLGQALALWLHGVPCEACSGMGETSYTHRRCPACQGDGTALGAYVAAQLDAEGSQRRIEEALRLSRRGTEADLRCELEQLLGVSEVEIDHDREAKLVTVRCRCEHPARERRVHDALDRCVPAGVRARVEFVAL